MTTSVRSRASHMVPRSIRGMALGALLTLPVATPALAGDWDAAIGPISPFAAFPIIGHDEMAQLRGGFNVAGLELQFGANVRTLIDNVVRLETVVHFTKAGLVSARPDLSQLAAGTPSAGGAQFANIAQQTAGLVKNVAKEAVNEPGAGASQTTSALGALANRIKGAALSSVGHATPSSVGQATANGAGAQPVSTADPATVSQLGSGGTQVDLSGLGDNIRGIVLNDTKGLTAAIQEVAQNRVTSTVINQANDRRIQVQLNLQVDVKNFSQYSEALRSSLLNQRLAQPNPNL